MCRSAKARLRSVAALVALGVILSACSDIYYDRRETIHLGAEDAVSINKVTHMYDPWPPASANRHIPGNGARVSGAIERYRTNTVTPPSRPATSSVGYAPAPPTPAAATPTTSESNQ